MYISIYIISKKKLFTYPIDTPNLFIRIDHYGWMIRNDVVQGQFLDLS